MKNDFIKVITDELLVDKAELQIIKDNLFGGSASVQQTTKLIQLLNYQFHQIETLQAKYRILEKDSTKEINQLDEKIKRFERIMDRIDEVINGDEL